MKRPAVGEIAARFFAESAGTPMATQRFNAVLFRNRVYVDAPRHMDAINLAFAGMSQLTKRHVSNRIADGKEKMLFGTALGDGTDWQWDEEWQAARMIMYGFD